LLRDKEKRETKQGIGSVEEEEKQGIYQAEEREEENRKRVGEN
jgi:hypothetical protein